MARRNYEVIPVTLGFGMIQSLHSSATPGKLVTNGASSPVMNLSEVDLGAKETERILRKFKDRYRRGDRKTLLELINMNPAFMLDPWVAEQYAKLHSSGWLSKGRGRQFGTVALHPLMVRSLVDWMINAGEARNKEKAFRRMQERGFCGYDTAKKRYYEVERNKYMRVIILKRNEARREISQAEFEEMVESANAPNFLGDSPSKLAAF
jgi:hypothetical protein